MRNILKILILSILTVCSVSAQTVDNGQYGMVDNLSYTYDGNQVTKVTDAVSGPNYSGAFHFRDGANATLEYEYDQNGNMTKDLNKNISSIQYNLLNLPSSINYQSGNMASYVYSASGAKLSVTYTNGATTTNNQYCGNMLYENGTLKQILIDGGYITFSGTTPQYHFYLKDHLGNNRVVCNASGTVEQINHYYPFGGLMGESTNGDVQRFKYNGKELDRMNGLDWLDYGARHMDGARVSWPTMDPLAEKYYDVSPYVYCKDNPVIYIDKDGKEIWIHYLDNNGNSQSFQYYVGITCDVDNSIAQSLVANLNTMYSNEAGKEVMDAILTSETKYGYSQADTHSEGGEGYFDPLTNNVNLNDVNNTMAFAEETFHLYQRINGQEGTTDVDEVEAKLFSSKLNYEIESWNDTSYLNNLSGVPGSSYTNHMNNLFWGGYNERDYKSAINNFFSGSNSGNIYKNLPGYHHGTIRNNPLIKKFLPVK